MEESVSDEKLNNLVYEIGKYRKIRIIGIILIPIVVGIFIFRYCNDRLKELEGEIRKGIEQELVELRTNYRNVVIDDTYLIWSVRTELLNHFDNRIGWITKILSYQDSFSFGLNEFVGNSKKEMSKLRYQIDKFNEEFVERRKKDYEYLFQRVPFPFDNNQKDAIIKDDKHNLIVAGAGSGKTEVLTTRIAYLIERKDKVKPERILALAFQRDASEEMKDRLKKRYDFDVKIKTFHALGREILKKAGKPSEVYGGDNHDKKFKEQIGKLYKKAEGDAGFRNEIINFLKIRGSEEVNEKTKFATKEEKEEYYEYMRNLRYRTLDDTVVKSLGERKIMNFFLTHKLNGKDITILYEVQAPWTKFVGYNDSISYPDFYLEDYDIWHEHWAVNDKDEKSKVPDWFEKSTEEYKRDMKIKRSRFNELKSTLIETYDFESKNENDFIELLKKKAIEKLTEKYPNEKFEFTPIEHDELVKKVWKMCKTSIDGISDIISRFIINAKTYGFTPEKIEKRLENEKWSQIQIIFGRIAVKIYREYQETLRKEGNIDFEDMINNCITVLNENKDLYHDLFDHILIDEYQDISKQRHILVETLMKKNPNCKLFCVGDDWQSIMSFAGSDLKYFVNFDKYFPNPERTDLTMNYRSIKSIVDTGAEIIKNNSGLKLEKETIAFNSEQKPINVYLSRHRPEKKYVSNYYDQITGHCFEQINKLIEKGYEPTKDILLLSRIKKNRMLNERLEGFIGMNGIPFKSVHSSKGLQSRAVFILDVRQGLYGFPCELENPKLLELAKEEMIHSKEEEERRLFYVAVTRAKENVFIYSQLNNESKFIDEIKEYTSFEELIY